MHFGFLGHIENKENFRRFIQEAKQRALKLRSPQIYFIRAEDTFLNNTFSIVNNASVHENLGFQFLTDFMSSYRINPYDFKKLENTNNQLYVLIIPIQTGYGNIQLLRELRSHFRLVNQSKQAA